MSVENAEIAERVVETLDAHGWTQGNFKDEDGSLCVLGAYRRQAGCDYSVFTSCDIIEENAWELGFLMWLGGEWSGIPDWNDHEDTTYGDVRDTLLRYAKDMRNQA